MADAGATVEMIVAAVKAAEEEDQRTIGDKRRNAAERQRRSRERVALPRALSPPPVSHLSRLSR
jgi:hypothetical protein